MEHLIPLKRFLSTQRSGFYAWGPLAYLQAWGLVHFLYSSEAHRPLVEQMLRDSREGVGVHENVKRLLWRIDEDELESGYKDYLRNLKT